MADLVEKRKEEGGRKIRWDPAKELAIKHSEITDLITQILTRMNLPDRTRRDVWYPQDSTQSPMNWLQQIFSDVNNGRHIEFTLPAIIEIMLPDPVFSSNELPLKLIDTKGIDQTAEREDLECHFDDPHTLVVLCTRFNDSPDIATQTLLQRAKEVGARNLVAKTVLLVLPRPEEALAVKYDSGSAVEDEQEGYEIKKDQIDLRLNGLGLKDLSIFFFNAKENASELIRNDLLAKIKEYRQQYCNQIAKLNTVVDYLFNNKENETIRLIFEQVRQRLATWIDKNREIEIRELPIYASLVKAIGDTRYASTVRASVRRYGHWENLDYYHHLAFGTRRIAVQMIGNKIHEFKIIVQNLVDDSELSKAKDFLNSVMENLDANVDTAYRILQLAGREAFKRELELDSSLWRKCEERWGAGSGYRNDIRDMTSEQLQLSSYDKVYQIIKHMLSEEWSKIIKLLEGMIKEKSNQIGIELKSKS